MNKLLTYLSIFSFAVVLIFISSQQKTYAEAKVSASSAAFIQLAEAKRVDNRVQILRDYLATKNSPLTDSAETFVTEADKYNLDWKFVAAISGLESGFGKQIPPYSYNGWGWGVYGTNVKYFTSWDDAISTVSQGLREQYMDKWKATDVYSIGRIYAASPTWAVRVEYFMRDIEKFQKNWSPQTLSLSI